MAGSRFFRYELRTTDVNAARAFYEDVFGPQFWDSDVSVVTLPEQAVARGAPAHWLGYVGVGDVDGTAARIVALGGQRLGPTRGTDGSVHVVLRDPFGAVIGVSSHSESTRLSPVSWHLHHSQDHNRSFALYESLFGWAGTDVREMGPQNGSHQMFAWDASGRTVGSMTSILSPAVHPQWLYFFPVADIEDSQARVRAGRGTALGQTQTPTGEIVVPCEDPQGAAFALYQFA